MDGSQKAQVDMLVGAELSLGLPGGDGAKAEVTRTSGKRGFSESGVDLKLDLNAKESPPMDPCDFSKDKIKSDPAKPPAK